MLISHLPIHSESCFLQGSEHRREGDDIPRNALSRHDLPTNGASAAADVETQRTEVMKETGTEELLKQPYNLEDFFRIYNSNYLIVYMIVIQL